MALHLSCTVGELSTSGSTPARVPAQGQPSRTRPRQVLARVRACSLLSPQWGVREGGRQGIAQRQTGYSLALLLPWRTPRCPEDEPLGVPESGSWRRAGLVGIELWPHKAWAGVAGEYSTLAPAAPPRPTSCVSGAGAASSAGDNTVGKSSWQPLVSLARKHPTCPEGWPEPKALGPTCTLLLVRAVGDRSGIPAHIPPHQNL